MACTISKEELARVKGLGFLNNRGTDSFNGRVITRNGKITSKEMMCIADAAEKFGNGELVFTTRLTVEIRGVHFDKIEPLREFLAENGFLICEEKIAVEDRRYYVVMSVIKGEESNRDEMSFILGRKLLEKNDDVTKRYFKKELQRFQAILQARGGENNAPDVQKIISELEKYV